MIGTADGEWLRGLVQVRHAALLGPLTAPAWQHPARPGGREQTATQRKLDELLRALPGASSGLMMLEQAPDDVLQGVEAHQRSSAGKQQAPDRSLLAAGGSSEDEAPEQT